MPAFHIDKVEAAMHRHETLTDSAIVDLLRRLAADEGSFWAYEREAIVRTAATRIEIHMEDQEVTR